MNHKKILKEFVTSEFHILPSYHLRVKTTKWNFQIFKSQSINSCPVFFEKQVLELLQLSKRLIKIKKTKIRKSCYKSPSPEK